MASITCSTSASSACTCVACGSGMIPRTMAMRLISSETACASSSAKPSGISAFAGHCGRPPALVDCSLMAKEPEQKKRVTNDIDRIAQCAWQHVVHDIDANVLIVAQRPRRAQQENHTEQHPLQFKPRIRRHVEGFADNRIDG